MSAYQRVYVEGSDDILTLEKIFPTMKGVLVNGEGKSGVRKKVQNNEGTYGFIDRDFASEAEVLASHGSESKVRILPRYCLESYLLEPHYLYELAVHYNIAESEKWNSIEAIQSMILAKGQELSYYMAANVILNQMKTNMSYRQLHSHIEDFPIIAKEEVRERLQERFSRLPSRDDFGALVDEWERKSEQIKTACEVLDGVHRLINGKTLLKTVIFSAFKEAAPKRFVRFKEEQFVEELAAIAEENPPSDLITIFRDFGIKIAY